MTMDCAPNIFLQSTLLLAVIDENSQLLEYSYGLAIKLGLKDSAAVVPKLSDYIIDADAKTEFFAAIEDVDSNETASAPLRLIMLGAEEVAFWASIHFVRSVYNEQSCMLASIQDCTEEEISEELQAQSLHLLEERTEDLEESNSSKIELLGMASHDLKAPLHKIGLIADMLLNVDLDAEEQRRFFTILSRSADSMTDLITDLLSISKIEGGTIDLNRESVPVQQLLETVEQEFDILAAEKNTVLEVQHDTACNLLTIDVRRILQVLNNLLSNAIKYSAPGSTVLLRLSCKDEYLFEVLDSGLGIPAAEQHLLFQPFKRLSPQPTAGEPSSGLGLAIAKKIVDLHGGSIGMQSRPEGGSLFWFALPT